jgi:hypothetical protein
MTEVLFSYVKRLNPLLLPCALVNVPEDNLCLVGQMAQITNRGICHPPGITQQCQELIQM